MKFTAVIALLVLVSMSGCVNLKPQQDKVSLYTLGANESIDADISETLPTYYVTRPELPGYLGGSAMFYHTESGQKASLKGARWGEDLSEGIARALGDFIQASGKANVRSQYPWPKLARDNPDIRILFKRFGAREDGTVEVVAIWQIRHAEGLIKEGTYQSENLMWDVNAPETYVAQLNAALKGLAQAIVSEL